MSDGKEQFRFELNPEEKEYLKDLVKLSILRRLQGKSVQPLPEVPSERLLQPFGAFVTLKSQGQLRGCIGRIDAATPLQETIAQMAQAAACEDPRFPPLSLEEFQDIEIEISILSPIALCPDTNLIEIGRHGLLVRSGARSGLLLPQVPVEWGWDSGAFLQHTCRKAGLPSDSWQKESTEIFWFEAEVF